MPRPSRPPSSHRVHYIVEWAEHRGLIQADIARELGVDKSTVSRWFDGAVPTESYLVGLAELLGADEPAALFRHPDDDWLTRFLRGRSKQERDQIKATLEIAFPPKQGRAA